MIELVVFDVNETVINLSKLEKEFSKKFPKYIFNLWFTKLLHTSLVISTVKKYYEFSKLAKECLQMILHERKIGQNENIDELLAFFKELPAHNDVLPTLQLLKEKNIKIVAFSNSNSEMLKKQLSYAKIYHLFDHVLSVEDIKTYKPKKEAYEYVLKKMNCQSENAVMVAAHDWDLFGAKSVGMKTVYIERKSDNIKSGYNFNHYYEKADVYGFDMYKAISSLLKKSEIPIV